MAKKITRSHNRPIWTATILFAGAFYELLQVGQNSGRFIGNFSAKWAAVLLVFALAALAVVYSFRRWQTQPKIFKPLLKHAESWRLKLSVGRWPLAVLIAAIPAVFVFYLPWGALLQGIFFRLLLFAVCVLLAAWMLSRSEIPSFADGLLALLIAAVFLVLAESFVLVNSYPFALHWSEGNRLWDYSILFGRGRYNYPANESIFVWIDPGRQALWGLPFVFSNLSIWGARLWGAVLTTIPYALLGWFAFTVPRRNKALWLLAGLWALIFLNQGPIYTPLVFSAILVAFARRKPMWFALPLVIVAGVYAGTSRFTWSFAPAIWAIMLTLSDAVMVSGKLRPADWLRAVLLGFAAMWSKGLPILLGVLSGLLGGLVGGSAVATPGPDAPGTQGVGSLEGLQATATSQPYTWYRLLPNETFPPGILLGLALATLPLILLLVYCARRGVWKTVFWQRLSLLAGGLAFLVVGVIASAKVGGGADLHNLDMFLITLVLVAGLVWDAGLAKQIEKLMKGSSWVRALFVSMVLVPALFPLLAGKPLGLPDAERTRFVLERVQDKVACAAQYGPVLFMDQRQLLTFGYVENVPLVPEYEKKFVMDQALAGNAEYFEQFHADLAAGRFALIVSEREGTTFKELDQESVGDSLVEENNAWTRWVSIPLLTYYESVGNYKDAALELFMPIERSFDCP